MANPRRGTGPASGSIAWATMAASRRSAPVPAARPLSSRD